MKMCSAFIIIYTKFIVFDKTHLNSVVLCVIPEKISFSKSSQILTGLHRCYKL